MTTDYIPDEFEFGWSQLSDHYHVTVRHCLMTNRADGCGIETRHFAASETAVDLRTAAHRARMALLTELAALKIAIEAIEADVAAWDPATIEAVPS